MTTQNYILLNQATNIVENVIVADESYMPPPGYLTLPDTTPAMVWVPVVQKNPQTQKPETVDYVLSEQIGAGGIGFTWNGSVLTTNEPKPQPPYPPIPA